MTPAIELREVTRTYRGVAALDSASVSFAPHMIHGLLGRNGAGKTTLMRLATGQDRPSAGSVHVFGADPMENAAVVRDICFIKESQTYPDLCVRDLLTAARWSCPRWDEAYAQSLLRDFELPPGRIAKKLSRGMRSALGIVIGLASRAPITIFDEPYLGLDPVARALFYDRLLEDYAREPRTIVLSTHLIDEVANLLERVVVIDRGRILLDRDADTLRGAATTVTAPSSAVASFTAGRNVIQTSALGSFVSATTSGAVTEADHARAEELGLALSPVSLQQLVVHATGDAADFGEPTHAYGTEGAAR